MSNRKQRQKRQVTQQIPSFQNTRHSLPLRWWFLLSAIVSAVSIGIVFIRSQASPGVMTTLANLFVIAGLLVTVIQTIYSIWPLSKSSRSPSPNPSAWQMYLHQHPRFVRSINVIIIGMSVLLLFVSIIIPLPSEVQTEVQGTSSLRG